LLKEKTIFKNLSQLQGLAIPKILNENDSHSQQLQKYDGAVLELSPTKIAFFRQFF
jgi:hypothetical protein